ncbi:MAG: tetratricopeptide repeat protein, partial [Candidatus Woesearchaeota archaeon]
IDKRKVDEILDFYEDDDPLLRILIELKDKDKIDLTRNKIKIKDSFVNRKDELDKLTNKLDYVKKGNCFSLFIAGEAGSGKTTLIKEFKKNIDEKNIDFLMGKSYTESSDFYLPLKNAFESYKKQNGKESPISLLETRPKNKDIEESDFIEAFRRSVFFDFTDKIKELTKNNPMVIFIDDLQWADRATIHLLNYMILNLTNCPVFIICAYRSEAINRKQTLYDITTRLSHSDKFEKIILKPFAWKETKNMIQSVTGSNRIPLDFIDLIYKKTEGNPMFIKEYIELLRDQKKLPTITSDYPNEENEIDTPQIIEDVLRRRLDILLSHKARDVAAFGSIIGDEIPFQLLNKCLDMYEIELLDIIDELLDVNIWEEDVENICYRFKHNLINNVIYDDMSTIKKRRLHKNIAEHIEELHYDKIEKYYSDIAYHYERSKDKHKAIKNYIKAGNEAKSLFAFDDAIYMYEKALNLCDNDEKFKILEKLAHVNKIIGNFKDAKENYRTILEKSDDSILKLNIRSKLGEIFITQGKYDKALDIAEDGLSCHESNDEFTCKLLSVKGRVYSRKGEYQKALKLFKKEKNLAEKITNEYEVAQSLHHIGAIKIHEGDIDEALKSLEKSVIIKERIDDKIGLGESLNNIGIVYEKKGDYEKALDYFNRTLEIEKEIGNEPNIMKTLNNLGIYSKIKGDIEQALEYYEKSLSIAKKIDDKPGMAKLNVNIGIIHGATGDDKQALNNLNRALKIQKDIEDKQGIATTLDNIGSIYQQKGHFNKSLDFHEESLEIGQEIGDKNSIARSLYNIGSVYDKKEKLEKALDYFDRSLEISEKTDNKRLKIYIYIGYSEIYIKQKKYEKAKNYAEKAYNLSKKIGLESELAISKRHLGKTYIEMNKLEKAEKELKDALDLVDNSPDETEKYKIYYELSKIFKKFDEMKKAKKYLKKSLNKFEEYNMNWWKKQCETALDDINT